MTHTLRYRLSHVYGGTSNPAFLTFGLVEPLSRAPGYIVELMSLYARARIVYSSIAVTGNNLGTTSLECCIGYAPANWTASFPELVEKRGTVVTLSSAKGGVDKYSLKTGIASKSVLGKEYNLADFDFDLSQVSSTTPLVADEPVWLVGHGTMTGNVTAEVRIVVDYTIEFFDLVPPS